MDTIVPQIPDAAAEVTREKVAQDLRILIRDAEALLKAGVSDAGSKMEELKARLQTSVGKMKETCHQLEEKVVAGAKATDKVIRAHPYESIGIAFGVGLLIGVLINRK
ncbi:MAG: hypothetical protein PCFJNLEI_00951 [Verrucomicrobiae bacterium]|nr:hypothetical protein [Verrucomicrobiae bacterium]